jgi:hypothetical protein
MLHIVIAPGPTQLYILVWFQSEALYSSIHFVLRVQETNVLLFAAP